MRSLAEQAHRDFELIIVDQNDDERLAPIIERYRLDYPIRVLHSRPGLSRARNVGLPFATGAVVAFPDDDCHYPADLLSGVNAYLEANPGVNFLSVLQADSEESLVVTGSPLKLSMFNLWGRVPSISLFFRTGCARQVGDFDEQLGVGAGTPWGAGEDTDYVLRALAQGAVGMHEPSLRVLHAAAVRSIEDAPGCRRTRAYARGLGRVLRKHRFPLWMVLGGCVLSFARACRALVIARPDEARWHLEVLAGRVEGWCSRREACQQSVDVR
jgi:glycosyltransferase involved in cell wall biosynthesis